MSRLNMKRRNWIPGCLAAMVALLVACSTDTPTAPVQEPSTPTPAIDAFIMSITVSPESVQVDSESPATVTVRATSRDTGANAPNGTTVVVSTTLGEFQESGSEIQQVAAVMDQGKARVFFFAGSVVGTASLRAELSGSVGRTSVDITAVPEDPIPPFITGLSPETGPASGGTTVTITGTRFAEPMRVNFGTKLATIVSVTDSQVRVTSPPVDPSELASQACDSNNDGEENGTRLLPTAVAVTMVIDGVDGVVNAGTFTFLPSSNACFAN